MSNEADVHLLVLAGQLSEVVVDHTHAAGAQPGTEVLHQAEHCADLISGIGETDKAKRKGGGNRNKNEEKKTT